jgi:hypothetical protein
LSALPKLTVRRVLEVYVSSAAVTVRVSDTPAASAEPVTTKPAAATTPVSAVPMSARMPSP